MNSGISESIRQRVAKEMPDISSAWDSLVDASFRSVPSSENEYQARAFLRDVADCLKYANQGIFWGMAGYYDEIENGTDGDLTEIAAPERFRSRFDHGAIMLGAMANKLTIAVLYGYGLRVKGKYPTLYGGVRLLREMKDGQAGRDEALRYLDSIQSSASWKLINSYRDGVIHQGLPILKGEVRRGYRVIEEKKLGRLHKVVQQESYEVRALISSSCHLIDNICRISVEFAESLC